MYQKKKCFDQNYSFSSEIVCNNFKHAYLNSYLVKISTADSIKRIMSESKVNITLSVFLIVGSKFMTNFDKYKSVISLKIDLKLIKTASRSCNFKISSFEISFGSIAAK